MELIYGFVRAHGYEFGTKSDHRTDVCVWCAAAKDSAVAHMRDATLKTTKSTKCEPDETPHVVRLTRLGRDSTSRGTVVNPCDLSDDTLRVILRDTESTWDRAIIEEVFNLRTKLSRLRTKLSRQRPVILDLEEGEAVLLLELLHSEVDAQTGVADMNYTNGSGYETDCARAREGEREAEALADRLRKLLGNHLDKAYAGELGL